jgi:hypothetical protein
MIEVHAALPRPITWSPPISPRFEIPAGIYLQNQVKTP